MRELNPSPSCWARRQQAVEPCSSVPARRIGASRPYRVALLLVAALGVVSTQGRHEHIWNVEEPKETGLLVYLRKYRISFAGIPRLGFLPPYPGVTRAFRPTRLGARAAAIGEPSILSFPWPS